MQNKKRWLGINHVAYILHLQYRSDHLEDVGLMHARPVRLSFPIQEDTNIKDVELLLLSFSQCGEQNNMVTGHVSSL